MRAEQYIEQTISVQDLDLLRVLSEESFVTQRILAEQSGYSLGTVNESLKNLGNNGYLTGKQQLTERGDELLKNRSPKNAVILAAGFGMRMVPINLTTPKAFLEINGERLIERIIKQLHEVGISNISVVAGFMKDSFEYLIDEYGVDLIVNEDYAAKNNMSSVSLVLDRIANTYIIPCDLWCQNNPFRKHELYSWYMVSDQKDSESEVRVNRKKELVFTNEKENGNKVIGIAYLLKEDAETMRNRINELSRDPHNDNLFWEAALYDNKRMIISARVVDGTEIHEINTYEQLRELDAHSNQLKSDAIHTIAQSLGCNERDIKEITVLKKGMTNRSFLFSVDNNKYIMRIPGEGTDLLINRRQEADVYQTISGLGLCDDPVYLNADNGYKITRYLEGIRNCDPKNAEDLIRCMRKLREFHSLRLKVNHTFDLFGQIKTYESLWDGDASIYRDYKTTKENVLKLKVFIDSVKKDWCLTHIDAVPDNFLFYTPKGEGMEHLQLTDWEYSGMQDPHVDIAMFCIYSLYDKKQCDKLIDIYFENNCQSEIRAKIYCYIAACGLLWSNWCEYKRKLGVEFGEYSLRQYRYAKDFYRHAVAMIRRSEVVEEA